MVIKYPVLWYLIDWHQVAMSAEFPPSHTFCKVRILTVMCSSHANSLAWYLRGCPPSRFKYHARFKHRASDSACEPYIQSRIPSAEAFDCAKRQQGHKSIQITSTRLESWEPTLSDLQVGLTRVIHDACSALSGSAVLWVRRWFSQICRLHPRWVLACRPLGVALLQVSWKVI